MELQMFFSGGVAGGILGFLAGITVTVTYRMFMDPAIRKLKSELNEELAKLKAVTKLLKSLTEVMK